MSTKKIQIIFFVISIIALIILFRNMYFSYSFKNNPLSDEYKILIIDEEQRVLKNMRKNLGYSYKFPIIITDKIPGKIYGLTSLEEDGSIKIYLNKKAMRESMDYIISDVIAHEYAHALLFKSGDYKKQKDGHSNLWKKICTKLGGRKCEKYVNSHDVIMGKLPF